MLKLMYITNRPQIAKIAEDAGVDRIFVDMEYIGKDIRQGGLDTVQSHHTIEDIRQIKNAVHKAQVLARVNPIHEKNAQYYGTEVEVEKALEAGADIIMLPMFQTAFEANRFLSCVGGRAKTLLLLETPAAVENLDEILKLPGIDEIHIGLNDLHLAYRMKFMFQLLADGTVEKIVNRIKAYSIPYGFGGIARIGYGFLPAEYVIAEHYRLGSTMAILSRSFCNAANVPDLEELRGLFNEGVAKIRQEENKVKNFTQSEFSANQRKVQEIVCSIVNNQA